MDAGQVYRKFMRSTEDGRIPIYRKDLGPALKHTTDHVVAYLMGGESTPEGCHNSQPGLTWAAAEAEFMSNKYWHKVSTLLPSQLYGTALSMHCLSRSTTLPTVPHPYTAYNCPTRTLPTAVPRDPDHAYSCSHSPPATLIMPTAAITLPQHTHALMTSRPRGAHTHALITSD